MTTGFIIAKDGEKGEFNKLSEKQKELLIKEHGWPKKSDSDNFVIAHFEISCFLNGKLESKHEYFERTLRSFSDVRIISEIPISVYYDDGVKVKTQEWSNELKKEEEKVYALCVGETVEFSRHKYPPFKETYQITLKNVFYGEMLDL